MAAFNRRMTAAMKKRFVRRRRRIANWIDQCSGAVLALIVLALSVSSSSAAQSITIAWDGSASRATGAVGFTINMDAPNYENRIDAGDREQMTLALNTGATYAFTVT